MKSSNEKKKQNKTHCKNWAFFKTNSVEQKHWNAEFGVTRKAQNMSA